MKKRYLVICLATSLIFAGVPKSYAAQVGKTCVKEGLFEGEFICINDSGKKKWQRFDSTKAVQAAINLAITNNALPKKITPAITKVRTNKSLWLDQECAVDFPDVKVPECIAGDLTATKTMVVYGDSHASMWMTALDVIAKKSNYKIYLFAKLACPLVEVPIWSYQLNRPFDECVQWQKLVLPRIEALKPEILIVTDQWKPAVIDGKKSDFDTPIMWQVEFPKALAKLKAMTNRLIVIGNNPSMQQDPVTCASKPKANIGLCTSGRNLAGNVQINRIEKDATINSGGTYIDTVDFACSQYLCPIVINNIFVYFDQWHFTSSYVTWLVPVLKKALAI